MIIEVRDPPDNTILCDHEQAPVVALDLTHASWRGPPSAASECSARVSHLSHESRIASETRKHEARIAGQWTNENFRVLSQLVNSLSLSQSDTDRILNAVKCRNCFRLIDYVVLGSCAQPW